MPVEPAGGRYAANIDLANQNDSHALIVRMVGGGKRVLDVGCWTGDMSAELARFNPRVVGIEVDPDAANQAKKVLDEVVVADVAELDFEKAFGPAAFDVIVFGDVLEHLTDPGLVLRNALACLTPGGFVVASLPNVAHGSVRINLLKGNFAYTTTGLLDRTHVRFFTRASVDELFVSTGMAIVELDRTIVDPLHTVDGTIDEATVPVELLREMRADIEAVTYQYVVKAVRDDRTRAVSALYDRAERAERQLSEILGRSPDGVVGIEASPALRVAIAIDGDATHVEHHHVRDILEREIESRLHRAVDVRLVDDEVALAPPGWGAHVVIWLGREAPALGMRHVRSVVVDNVDLAAVDPTLDTVSASGLFAPRLADGGNQAAHLEVLRAAGRFPAVDGGVLIVVLRDEPISLVEELARTVATEEDRFAGVVVLTPDSERVGAARFEALWPGRCVVSPRPSVLSDVLALFGASDAVVSALPFDRAIAASLGIRTAATDQPETLLCRLDGSHGNAPARAHATLALDRAIDQALVGVPPVTDAIADEIARLRSVVAALHSRLFEERMRLADSIAELQLRVQQGEASQAREARLSAWLDVQRDAIVQLQDDCSAVLRHRAAPTVEDRSLVRRVRGRVGRLLRKG